MKWAWIGKSFVWYWLKKWDRTICAKMVPRNLTEHQRDARLSAVFDIQMHYGDAAASLLTWSRTLRLLFISKSKIGSERTQFWVHVRHLEVSNASLKRHPTNYVPRMLQTVAAPLENVCAGTRDVLWRWPLCSSWINKIKLFFGTSLITLLSDLVLPACIRITTRTRILTQFWFPSSRPSLSLYSIIPITKINVYSYSLFYFLCSVQERTQSYKDRLCQFGRQHVCTNRIMVRWILRNLI